ncbi:hypothetical protein KHA93_00315 [Bacillus sp. FJAT-49732]|uniref:Uncharacterized protein n=1 Tax=Lederbergia citrisecunda TaxID=2833583 RepID=A0A942TJ91_9BACI|nr:hypothetical protein [Lederbergia citrisecunda]MBS4198103.1 hypothetical protein [Lederbergia citrisecunda]
MIKKLIILGAFLNLLFITGCGGKEFDFEGKILEIIDPTTIRVGEDAGDPTALYPMYDITINENTNINGKVDSASDLKVGQNVNILIQGDEDIYKSVELIATEIIVE